MGDQHRVGRRRGQFLEVVGHQNGRQLRLRVVQAVEGGEELLPGRHVEAGRRFVQEQQGGVGQERPRDERPAALALRHGGPGGVPEPVQAEHLDEVVGPVEGGLVRLPPAHQVRRAGRPGEHDLPHRERRTQRVPGVDVPDRLPQPADLDPAQPVAEDVDRAAGRMRLGAAQAHQCALARPVGADERPPLTRPDREVDAGEDPFGLADEVDVAKAQHLGPRRAHCGT